MPRTPQPVNPADSPWHLLGSTIRHWRENAHFSQRGLAEMVHVDHTMISAWERAASRMDISSARAIDTALEANGQIAELHALVVELARFRVSNEKTSTSGCNEDDVERRTLLQLLMMMGAGSGIPASAVDALHAGLGRTTDHAAENGVSDWEQIAWDYAQGVWTEPPGSRFADLTGDIRNLEQALTRAQAPAEHTTLLRVYAQLAAFLALELAETSSARACWRSWRAARSAADASGDRELSVWIRAEEATQSFYLRRLGPAAGTLIEEAVHLADGRPCLGLTEALKTRSRILAEAGQVASAREVLDDFRGVYDRLPTSVTDDPISVWGLPLDSAQYAEAFVLTKLGDGKSAMPMLEQALASCPREKAGGRANIGLIQAWGLVQDRDVTEGLGHALDLATALPTTIARRKIMREVVAALPERARTLPAARELHALTTGDRPG
ncbi:helix-turn-helix transcriptional regulator [Streptosporangium sp. NPDC023963]|uniref:helix-turn-helix domain-containing protein n=1 Tax=Streptosporangium sp. NPDC023963 TaxID=3155608 RepID=UPI00344A2641